MLQIAEILDQSILTKNNFPINSKISINLKPGFLIHFPIDIEILDLLSGVLSHQNVYLFTFDFTSDISSLQDSGIKIYFGNILDAQLTNDYSNPLLATGCEKILDSVMKFSNRIEEAEMALKKMTLKKDQKNLYYSSSTFLFRNDKDPFLKFINPDFYFYAASDIVLTGIAALSIFINGTQEKVWKYSQKKVELFKLAQKDNIYLKPSAMRQFEFIKSNFYNFPRIIKTIPSRLNSIDDIKTYLSYYSILVSILDLKTILDESFFISLSDININDLKNKIENLLLIHEDQIYQLFLNSQ